MDRIQHICCIVGTRPEVVKMAPVIYRLKQQNWAKVFVLATAQHRQMLDDMLETFQIHVDADLNIMEIDQSLSDLTSRLLTTLGKIFAQHRFNAVLSQGDTTTLLASALSAFYQNIPFGHIEAGLRTGDRYNPFPEEMNRTLTSSLATWHFAPTTQAKENLLREAIPKKNIFVTGNTVIDSLLMQAKRNIPLNLGLDKTKRLILVTAHRRESFGEPLQHICQGIAALAKNFSDIQIVFLVHPNPKVSVMVHKELENTAGVILVPAIDYGRFVMLMKRAYLIMTDSGGVEEEAPALGKPVLVLREKTERPELIEKGLGKLVGTDAKKIVRVASELLTNKVAYKKMAKRSSIYGDGKAAIRIVRILREKLLS